MRNRRGQGLIEYLILVCIISIAAIGIVTVVGTNIREQYANISNALRKKQKVNFTETKLDQYKSRGLDDYMDAATE
jgi:pilus assembly protein Flp/PilA